MKFNQTTTGYIQNQIPPNERNATPESEKEISLRIARLSEEIDGVKERVEYLIDRISPVLSGPSPTEGQAIVSNPNKTELGGVLYGLKDKASEINELLRSTLNRLEI